MSPVLAKFMNSVPVSVHVTIFEKPFILHIESCTCSTACDSHSSFKVVMLSILKNLYLLLIGLTLCNVIAGRCHAFVRHSVMSINECFCHRGITGTLLSPDLSKIHMDMHQHVKQMRSHYVCPI